ncbi:MAG TPA: sigma-70 family RNA polymerase sigma factor [Candidatus Limnocylindrales bacterium]
MTEGSMDNVGTLATERDRPRVDRDDDLALAARSDPDAFGLLYERHRLAIYRYLRTRTRSDDDAGELTAIVFERALQAIPRYRPSGGGFVAWLIRIARNAAVDSHRRAATAPLDIDLSDVRAAGTPEERVLADEARSSLLTAVAGLPPIQREAIVLRYAAGLTAREIGEVIGRSDQATQKLLTRALATIRETYRVDF